ncbi:telomeric repeat-binding factor 1 isoform X3 [Melanerpes formicivorus]|uniref:telomeric repeat-binding factor 1 isoform X3 n=1 Tax=Melanerpes formicivorus TaxID=211600 RepID=UPI00358F6047
MAVGGGGGAIPLGSVEALAADWMLEFACYCLCRHFGEERPAEFQRWRDVAQALLTGLSRISTQQRKKVYVCQLLMSVAEGKELEWHFKNEERISPLESALSFWTLLEREEMKLDKLHEDIRRLLQIQAVAVHMEKGYFKEAADILERLFTDSESDKAATQEVESKGLGAIELQNPPVNVKKSPSSSLETKQRSMKEKENITNQSPGGKKNLTVRPHSQKHQVNHVLGSLNSLQNVENNGDALARGRKRQRWTNSEDLELKSGVRKFGVGNWAKILVHGNFKNRTSVMLKDRWRTLCRTDQS